MNKPISNHAEHRANNQHLFSELEHTGLQDFIDQLGGQNLASKVVSDRLGFTISQSMISKAVHNDISTGKLFHLLRLTIVLTKPELIPKEVSVKILMKLGYIPIYYSFVKTPDTYGLFAGAMLRGNKIFIHVIYADQGMGMLPLDSVEFI